MNRRLLTWINLAALAALVAPAANAETKIGLIDFARLQREFFKTDVERKNFDAKRKDALEKVNERREKLKSMIEEQQGADKSLKDPTLSKENKEKVLEAARERMGKITSLQKESIELDARANAELATLANEIQRNLTKEIYDMIGTIAAEKGLDLVFNRTFGINGVPTLAYSATKTLEDFTDEVSKRLNKDAPAGWKPPASGSGEIGADK